jgi:hypothetical protein
MTSDIMSTTRSRLQIYDSLSIFQRTNEEIVCGRMTESSLHSPCHVVLIALLFHDECLFTFFRAAKIVIKPPMKLNLVDRASCQPSASESPKAFNDVASVTTVGCIIVICHVDRKISQPEEATRKIVQMAGFAATAR